MTFGVSIAASSNAAATSVSNNSFTGAGTNYVVKTPTGVFYLVYINGNSDVMFTKSTDGGETWAAPTAVFTGSVTQLAIWYDRWSGISAGLIHCAYTESAGDDTLYRSIDTENTDTLGTETTIFAGATTAAAGALSITRARGGNLYCKVCIDAGAEGGFFRSTDVGATWGARTDTEALALGDQWALVPGFAADTQDIMCIFLDNSASEISRYVNDDSGDSWAETSIATGVTVLSASTAFPNFAVAVDLTNSQILLGVWTAADLLGADLLVFTVTESAITAKTDVITNSIDDQGLCAVGIDTDTGDWYAFYAGEGGNGSDTFATALTLNYKKSTDDGATWGSETQVGLRAGRTWLIMTPRFDTEKVVMRHYPLGLEALFDVAAAAGSALAPGNMTGGLQ
jgi:hypothetical protein